MMLRWLYPIVFLMLYFLPNTSPGQVVRIRIEPFSKLNTFTFQCLSDEVVVTAQDSFPVILFRLNTLDQFELYNHEDGVRVEQDGKILGVFPQLIFWANDGAPRFKILSNQKGDVPRTYPGHLLVRPGARGLEIINEVHLEDYIRCVIHAEAGHHKNLDFFKVQALSARTYALRNLKRHGKLGYDLCDNTHCQAYKGEYSASPLLEQAVLETKGEVIVYGERELIDAVFSANCGGYTANSEDVWVADVSYLRATSDYEFCEGFSNHAWHITIPKVEFLAKLGRYMKINATGLEIVPDVSGRVKRIVLNGQNKYSISGEEIRRLYRLKSSKFHIFDANSLLFIEGLGFGHGVGMCQDGAYYLSKMGMDYTQIIQHYYQGVSVVPIDKTEEL